MNRVVVNTNVDMPLRDPFKFLLWGMILLAGVFVCGCHKATRGELASVGPKPIKEISFSGNKLLSENELKSYLQLRKGDIVFEDDVEFSFQTIVEAYASKGYFETEIKSVKTTTDRRGRLRIHVEIVEGKPVLVDQLSVVWRPRLSTSGQIEKAFPLKVGSPASTEDLNKTVAYLEKRLQDEGRPLAEVSEKMTIRQETHTADVSFNIVPGAVCRIGKIRLFGLVFVPEELVTRELEPFQGELFTTDTKEAMEDVLVELNVFGSAVIEVNENSVEAGERASETVADIDVSVVESDFQTMKLGVGVQFEPNRFLGWTSAVYQHTNLWGRLNLFRLRLMAGWALVPAVWKVEDTGPVALFEPSITKKGFLERNLLWNLTCAVETDVEENYKLFTPSCRPSVSRSFFKRLFVRLGYNIEYIMMYGIQSDILRQLQQQYEDLRSPIRLADLSAGVRLMLTDNVGEPNNGLVLKFTYWHSGEHLGSEVRYNKIQPTAIAYWRIAKWLQLAVRGELGFIYPFDNQQYTAIRPNFFLGGYNTVRGWGGKRLSPWVRVCNSAGEECEKIHLGGRTMVLANVELRFRVSKPVHVVLFADGGDVQYEVKTIVSKAWNYSAGSGVRLVTPIGKFRLDLGFRLNDPEYYKAEPRFGVHLGLGEVF